MKILVAGLGRKVQHEHSIVQCLSTFKGIDAQSFFYGPFLRGKVGYISERFLIGPVVKHINLCLLEKCEEQPYDVLFLYRALLITPETVKKIKSFGTKVVTFNPDTIYGANGSKRYFDFYRKSLPFSDYNFVYRASDLQKYQDMQLDRVSILRSFYVPKLLENIVEKGYYEKRIEVGFYGHCEPDKRVEIIKNLYDRGFEMQVKGRDWPKYFKDRVHGNKVGNSLNFDAYNDAISSTKCCLCFFSTWNEDNYTRRVFEIPAVGSLIVSPRNSEMLSLYGEDEALYYSDVNELSEKLKLFCNNEEIWTKTVQKSKDRLRRSGHDIQSRMNEFIEVVRNL